MDWLELVIQALSKLPTSSIAQVLRVARTRGNLSEDLKAIRDLTDMGLIPAEYRGAVIDVKFADNVDSAAIGETGRLTTNLFRILDRAKSVKTTSELKQPGDEFMYRWVKDACNESNDTLQEMWARVLTGEMERPGKISRLTHSVVRELTPEVAEKFRTLCSYAMCTMDGKHPIMVASLTPDAVMTDSRDLLKNYGLDYSSFLEMVEYRLLSLPLENSYTLPVHETETKGFNFLLGDECWILGIPPVRGIGSVSFPGILFTSAGRQLFPVVERFLATEYMNALECYFKNTWHFSIERVKWPLYPPDKFVSRKPLNKSKGIGNR